MPALRRHRVGRVEKEHADDSPRYHEAPPELAEERLGEDAVPRHQALETRRRQADQPPDRKELRDPDRNQRQPVGATSDPAGIGQKQEVEIAKHGGPRPFDGGQISPHTGKRTVEARSKIARNQSRSSSLIEVLLRVCASTFLTITAQ